VQGLTSANANFEGILVANASFVNVFSNAVVNNKSLNPSTATCPGIPDFETAEGFDCGEGIHLMGVDHSTVANNIVTNNAGGILLSDEIGPTFNNLITGNQGGNNPYDCGITLPRTRRPRPPVPRCLWVCITTPLLPTSPSATGSPPAEACPPLCLAGQCPATW